jgi:hypothetical protein
LLINTFLCRFSNCRCANKIFAWKCYFKASTREQCRKSKKQSVLKVFQEEQIFVGCSNAISSNMVPRAVAVINNQQPYAENDKKAA